MYYGNLKRHEKLFFAFWLSTAGERRGSCRDQSRGESTAAALGQGELKEKL